MEVDCPGSACSRRGISMTFSPAARLLVAASSKHVNWLYSPVQSQSTVKTVILRWKDAVERVCRNDLSVLWIVVESRRTGFVRLAYAGPGDYPCLNVPRLLGMSVSSPTGTRDRPYSVAIAHFQRARLFFVKSLRCSSEGVGCLEETWGWIGGCTCLFVPRNLISIPLLPLLSLPSPEHRIPTTSPSSLG